MKKNESLGGIARTTYSSSKADASSPILTLENMEKLYAQASVFAEEPRTFNYSWWMKILFFFLPTIVSRDSGFSDHACTLYFKKWRGKLYLVGEDYA